MLTTAALSLCQPGKRMSAQARRRLPSLQAAAQDRRSPPLKPRCPGARCHRAAAQLAVKVGTLITCPGAHSASHIAAAAPAGTEWSSRRRRPPQGGSSLLVSSASKIAAPLYVQTEHSERLKSSQVRVSITMKTRGCAPSRHRSSSSATKTFTASAFWVRLSMLKADLPSVITTKQSQNELVVFFWIWPVVFPRACPACLQVHARAMHCGEVI